MFNSIANFCQSRARVHRMLAVAYGEAKPDKAIDHAEFALTWRARRDFFANMTAYRATALAVFMSLTAACAALGLVIIWAAPWLSLPTLGLGAIVSGCGFTLGLVRTIRTIEEG